MSRELHHFQNRCTVLHPQPEGSRAVERYPNFGRPPASRRCGEFRKFQWENPTGTGFTKKPRDFFWFPPLIGVK